MAYNLYSSEAFIKRTIMALKCLTLATLVGERELVTRHLKDGLTSTAIRVTSVKLCSRTN